jgi:type IV pilus assembly protein PilN
MKVRLNLATRPLQTHRRFLAGSGLVGLLASLTLLVLSWHAYSVWKADQDFRAKMEQVQRRMADLRKQRQELEEFFARQENRNLHDRSAYLNSLIDQRSFNWTQMFMDLEKLLPGGVRVVSISPKLEKGRVSVKLVIGASSDDGKLKFLKALESSKEFTDIKVLGERAPNRGESADVSLVELTAWYLKT